MEYAQMLTTRHASMHSATERWVTNLIWQSFTLELVEITTDNKAMAKQFGEIVDRTEAVYACGVIYFTTDVDGGSKKGCKLLHKARPWLFTPSCWAHQFQLTLGDYFCVYAYASEISEAATSVIGWINGHGKVRKMFDSAQEKISLDREGKITVLAYLVANLTRWTTHYVAFMRLLRVKDALKLKVIQHRSGLIKAQVGAAKYSDKLHLTEGAEKHCNIISDHTFWNGLEQVVGDIEPICYGTNINQKDLTRPDQVLLTLVGMFLHFSAHPEPEVVKGMTKRLERRWKDCDQPLFLLALILNTFKGLTCFGEQAGLNHFKCLSMLLAVGFFFKLLVEI